MYLTRGPNTSTCVLVFITLSTSEALSKGSHHERKKITGFYENVSQNGDPPYCICEILIQICYRKFRDKIKMRQNRVNHHNSHPKFRFSTKLMQWTPKMWQQIPLDENFYEVHVSEELKKFTFGKCLQRYFSFLKRLGLSVSLVGDKKRWRPFLMNLNCHATKSRSRHCSRRGKRLNGTQMVQDWHKKYKIGPSSSKFKFNQVQNLDQV